MVHLAVVLSTLLAATSSAVQETRAESLLQEAVKKTLAQGFRYTIRPAASLPNFSLAKEELAGAPVEGWYHQGVFHAQDGLFEIYKKGGKVAVRTEGGWLALDPFLSPLRQAAKEAFEGNGERWGRGNVTQGRKALEQIIRLDHLVHRSDIHRLTALGTAFGELRGAGAPQIDGKPAEMYEGDLTDMAAFNLLQGPFDELVRRGALSFQGLSGVGRVYLQDGVLRRVAVKAGGKYGFYNEEDNVRRRGYCTLEILATLAPLGETKVEIPQEAARILGD